MKSALLHLLAVAAAIAATLAPARAEVQIPDEYRIGGFAIGCQAYTFNRFSAFEAIEKTAQAGGRVIEFYPGQKFSKEEPNVKLDHNMSDEYIDKLKAKLAEHHLMAVNYGVVGLPNDEAESRKVFAFAKKLGLRAVTSEPQPDAMDVIEKLVKEFDVMMAIHNHPGSPANPKYKHWDPNFVLSLVKDRDARLGSCADVGHWLTSGVDPVEALKLLKGRVISSHLKDRNVLGEKGHHDVPFGSGVGNTAAVLDELKRQGFTGNISIEYEHNWDNSVIDVAQCIGFVRGYTAKK